LREQNFTKDNEGNKSGTSGPSLTSLPSVKHSSAPKAQPDATSRCDNVEDQFGEAIIHQGAAHRVLGEKLLPFSRWHAAQLDLIRSPFAGHERDVQSGLRKKIDFAALWLAVQICQSSYPVRAYIESPPKSLAKKFGRTRGKSLLLFIAELNKFSAYIRDYATAPEYVLEENDGGSATVKTPWYLYQSAALAQSGMTMREAWNLPLGEGNWWLAASAEAKGVKIDIIQPADRRQLEELQQVTGHRSLVTSE
jgi:hypothetical protein